MQVGAMDVFLESPQERNLKKDLLIGVASSTVYTLVIIVLLQLNIFQTPTFFLGQ